MSELSERFEVGEEKKTSQTEVGRVGDQTYLLYHLEKTKIMSLLGRSYRLQSFKKFQDQPRIKFSTEIQVKMKAHHWPT